MLVGKTACSNTVVRQIFDAKYMENVKITHFAVMVLAASDAGLELREGTTRPHRHTRSRSNGDPLFSQTHHKLVEQED